MASTTPHGVLLLTTSRAFVLTLRTLPLPLAREKPTRRSLQPRCLAGGPAAAQTTAAAIKPLPYPQTRKVDTVTTYFGTKVADPYRWLENDQATRHQGAGCRQRTR
ncbi:MAG: hypothetical protein WKG07_38560 [Hymenobacter sp.]